MSAKCAGISCANVGVVFKREFLNYFNTPIGFVFLAIFSFMINVLFFVFTQFWEAGIANLDRFFATFSLGYVIFIPAVTMRLWAEEKRSGTIELLFTMPIRHEEAILGKYFSALAFLAVALASTLFVPLTVAVIADPDWFLIFGGYIGAFFMGSAYISMGLMFSWLTKDQIVAFLFTVLAIFVLYLLGLEPVLEAMGSLKPIAAFFSVSWHYESLSRGLFDSRDIIYFISFSALFLYLNYRSITNRR
ncbi:MAG: ABC transporter permease subunit [Spirochaetia bacterium]|nr:ABC transporter permease subunit [Spirochaetia bacterium]